MCYITNTSIKLIIQSMASRTVIYQKKEKNMLKKLEIN